MLDLNRYRAPSRFWERVKSSPFAQAVVLLCLAAVVLLCLAAVVLLCLAAVVAAQLR